MYLILDTTVLIDAERDGTQLDRVVGDDDAVSIAAVTHAELLHGVEVADGRRRRQRQALVEAVAAVVPIIAYDRRVAATATGDRTVSGCSPSNSGCCRSSTWHGPRSRGASTISRP